MRLSEGRCRLATALGALDLQCNRPPMMLLQLIGARIKPLQGPRYDSAPIASSADHSVSLAAACARHACRGLQRSVADCTLDGTAEHVSPVAPYAKMHTRYPSSALCTSCETSSNTSACSHPCRQLSSLCCLSEEALDLQQSKHGACGALGAKTRSKLKAVALELRPCAVCSSSKPPSPIRTADCASSAAGRTRTNTRMAPLRSRIVLCISRRTLSASTHRARASACTCVAVDCATSPYKCATELIGGWRLAH